MTVQETIKKNLLTCPSLYENKWDVLFGILCSYGIGYEWNENGEIEQKFTARYVDNIKSGIELQLDSILSDKSLIYSSPYSNRNKLKIAILRILDWENNMNKFIAKPKLMKMEKYLSIDHSPIFNVPDNITKDWKEAVLEMIEYLLTILTNETYIMRLQEIKEKIS